VHLGAVSRTLKCLALAGIVGGLAAVPRAARAEPDPKPKKNEKSKKKPKADGASLSTKFGDAEVSGRVIARAELMRHYETEFDTAGVPREHEVTSFDVSVPSARLGARYRSPTGLVSAEVDLELTDGPELRDAWIRVMTDHVGGRAGQFKVPFSAVEMESRLTLPMASRGLVHDILVDRLEVAGRRPGLTVTARQSKKKRGWSVTAGSFQGSVLVGQDGTDRDTELLSEESLGTQSFVARAEYAFRALTLGAGWEQRVGTPAVGESERYFTAGVDAVLDTSFRGRGLRLWVEGILGDSWLEHTRKPTDDENAVFATGRLIAAVRFGGGAKLEPYLEPYGAVSVFEPDTAVAYDFAAEEAIGVNVGLWKVGRVGLEGAFQQFERNFPRAYDLGANPDRWNLLVQAAAEF